MSEATPSAGEPPLRARRPTFNDIRDDYDDDFGRVVTPRDRARRRLIGPAVGIILTGALGVGLAVCGIFVVAVYALGGPLYAEELVLSTFFISLLATGGYLFWFVAAGGAALVRLRQYRLALFAAVFVTALSLIGFYSFLLYPFGIWALVVLFGANARKEFAGRAVPATVAPTGEASAARTSYGDIRDDYDDQFGQVLPPDVAIRRRVRIPAYVMMVFGALGIITMMVVTGYQILDFSTSSYRDEGELLVILFFTSLGTAYSAVTLYGGWCLLKQQRYVLVVVAAFFLTATSLTGGMAVLFYPFGIWALILLFRPEVRAAFGFSRSASGHLNRRPAGIRLDLPTLLKVGGAVGAALMLMVFCIVVVDFVDEELDETEALLGLIAAPVAACGFAGLFAHGHRLSKRRRVEPATPGSVSP